MKGKASKSRSVSTKSRKAKPSPKTKVAKQSTAKRLPTGERVRDYMSGWLSNFYSEVPNKEVIKELDYRPKSLKRLDDLIYELWGKDGPPDDENFDHFVKSFGSYVSRVLERNIEGRWVIKKGDDLGYEFCKGGKATGVIAFPYEWTLERLWERESLADKYTAFARLVKKSARF